MDYEQATAHYIQLAEQMLDEAFDENRRQWIDRMEAEMPPIRRVFAWLEEEGDALRGLRLAYFLQELWFEEQHTQEGLDLIQIFLALPDQAVPATLRAMCLDLAGAFALAVEDLDLARSLKVEAISLFRELEDPGQLGYALLHLGHLVGYAQGKYAEAETIYREALEIFSGQSNEEGIAHATANLASVNYELGDYAAAQTLTADALRRYSEMDAQWDLALTLSTAAGIAARQGRNERAVQLAAASAAHRERIGVSLPPAFTMRLDAIEAAALSGIPDEKQRTAAWKSGQAMSLAVAAELALG